MSPPGKKKRQRSRAREVRRGASCLPAKFTAPRLQGAIPRTRLFSWLNKQAQRPLIWLSGPPGSGKNDFDSQLSRGLLAQRCVVSNGLG